MDIINIEQYLAKKGVRDHFIFHPDFFKEYKALVSKSGEEKRINELFYKKLCAIIELDDIDCGLQWLEQLKKYGDLYSLHIKTKNSNYRLLFSKGTGKKYFLHIFFERSGKKATAYDSHIPIAIARRDEVKGGEKNEQQ